MDQSQSFFSPPKLPRKRKSIDTGVDQTDNSLQEQEGANAADQGDIPPEMLAAYEQEVKNTPSSVELNIPVVHPGSRMTAPILEDYIDPFTVPILYLLDEASAAVKKEDTDDVPENI